MFKRILIANRGEIAVRIIRACRELGVSPIAVHSEIDAQSLHVRLADEAYPIGSASAADSYLNIDRILEAARLTGVDAIHPGYGFLSENPDFAEAVLAMGIAFIGPPPGSMALLGEKTRARALARSAGVPIVPGMDHPTGDFAVLHAEAGAIGFPLLLKAAAGGGGKGMRRVECEAELEAAFQLASAEAAAYFGDPRIYAERCLEEPRHIEIQVLGDRDGAMIHLGERECSLQRRHQKVIEECPSPLQDDALREVMGDAAIRLAIAAGYHNAGTVEFLVDRQKRFFFLEVNTRIQVEHPVTEWVTGVDLVQWQIRIASGEALPLRQSDVAWRGAAIECRIYAEDPGQDFSPSPGVIAHLRFPEGPGIRVDEGVFAGWRIPVDYDPLLAKLTVWGEDREAAINRMSRALREIVIDGIRTPIRLFQRILEDEDFRRGAIDTEYLSRFLSRERPPESMPAPPVLSGSQWAALAAVVHRHISEAGRSWPNRPLQPGSSNWKTDARRSNLRGEA
ncbi:MAG: acetyl-CoA carboxylase biotin carboxylase subunit [Acidobacteria bacterium]|nr:acetyl-CoA carboxylase biotin carboxylase subunit [Acidobacteriota bacterium]